MAMYALFVVLAFAVGRLYEYRWLARHAHIGPSSDTPENTPQGQFMVMSA